MGSNPLGGRAAAPLHFWAISIASLLWNGLGGYDYIMSRQRNAEYLGQIGDAGQVLAWIDSFPVWAQVLWPIGVWGSVLGSVLLLLRSRHAASAFLISLIGAIGSFAAQLTTPLPPSMDTTASRLMPVVVLAIVVLLWWFARRSRARGIIG